MVKKRVASCLSEPQEPLAVFLMGCDSEAEGDCSIALLMYFPHFIGFNCAINFLNPKGFPLGLFPNTMESIWTTGFKEEAVIFFCNNVWPQYSLENSEQ